MGIYSTGCTSSTPFKPFNLHGRRPCRLNQPVDYEYMFSYVPHHSPPQSNKIEQNNLPIHHREGEIASPVWLEGDEEEQCFCRGDCYDVPGTDIAPGIFPPRNYGNIIIKEPFLSLCLYMR